MPHISNTAAGMPASAIRKLTPLADKAKEQGVNVYHLNIGAPDIKSPDGVFKALRNIKMDHIAYENSAGMAELRHALAEKYYRRVGIDVDASEVIINVAGSEAVELSIGITCDHGDELIVIEPYYTNYSSMAYRHGIKINAIHSDIHEGFKVPPIEEFEKVVTPRTKAVLICNPGNPTGTLYTEEELIAIGDFCVRHDLFLISDEVYREFCYSDTPHFSAINIPGAEQNVIITDSASKRYNLCGARVGCIVSHNQEFLNAVIKFAQARLCAPVIGQIAVLGAIDTPQSYFDEVREEYIRRRNVTVEALNRMPGVYSPLPMGAFYTIAELPVDDAEFFCRWMLEDFRVDNETVMITPAASFYYNREYGLNHVRIAYVLEVPKLIRAMKILEKGLKAYNKR